MSVIYCECVISNTCKCFSGGFNCLLWKLVRFIIQYQVLFPYSKSFGKKGQICHHNHENVCTDICLEKCVCTQQGHEVFVLAS